MGRKPSRSSWTPPEPLPPPELIVPRDELKARLSAALSAGQGLLERLQAVSSFDLLEAVQNEVRSWHNANYEMLRRAFTTQEIANSYRPRGFHTAICTFERNYGQEAATALQDIGAKMQGLREIIDSLEHIPERADAILASPPTRPADVVALQQLELIFSRFHLLAREVRRRHESRETLDITDEYDVQDFLRVLLKLFFDDVREEDPAPTSAGASSRIDFVLKAERIVVEVKKTRKSLRDKQVGEELAIDTVRYRSHPDCQVLVCFVYDPEGLIANPRGLERDLSGVSSAHMKVALYIRP